MRRKNTHFRLDFQRDRDRIIHTTAFRRLEYKTQVFVYSEGDHYRNRLTHSIEVAQIGRTLARSLGCNEDLTEAICLAHDLGHPPFGHVGEETLDRLMADHGGFDHQRQTYRILTELECRYPDHPGAEPYVRGAGRCRQARYRLRSGRCPSFQRRVSGAPWSASSATWPMRSPTTPVIWTTDCAAAFLTRRAVAKLSLAQKVLKGLDADPDADLHNDMLRYRFVRRLVGMEVTDAVTATAQALERAGVQTPDDVRRLDYNAACSSVEMTTDNRELKHFLFHHFYRHFRVARMAAKAERTLTSLFTAYVAQPQQLAPELQERIARQPDQLHRVVCDYLAGMTDRYAIQEYKRLFDIEERA